MRRKSVFLFAGLALAVSGHAQEEEHNMPGMQHSQMDHAHMAGMHHEAAMSPAENQLASQASGTSRNPESWAMPMLMRKVGQWHLDFMGNAFFVDTQQSGPRGRDKLYSANWFMVSAEHRAGRGAFSLELMGSLEPLTVTQRRYPELFQTGETAYGRPIVDGQHPHDLIMSLGLHYVRPVGEDTYLQLYAAPVGDPALGPVAYPHRASAMELPQAPLGHHWQDSTHIADEVVTAGLMHRWILVEASGFHGREPNENRWNIDSGAIDSWSGRLSIFPARNWSAQVSAGRLAHPEVQEPGDMVRATASVSYTRPMRGGDWAWSLIWGRNHNTAMRLDSNSYLAETVVPLTRRNLLTARVELVDKSELFPGSDNVYRIAAATAGYTHDFDLFPHVQTGIGANVTAYRVPAAIQPQYGEHPFGVSVYLRFRLKTER